MLLTQNIPTGLATAAPSFAIDSVNSMQVPQIPGIGVSVTANASGAVSGTQPDGGKVLPNRLPTETSNKVMSLFVNADPSPNTDITSAGIASLISSSSSGNGTSLSPFVGALQTPPDLTNQAQNLMGSAVQTLKVSTGAGGLQNAASSTNAIISAGAITSGSGKALASVGNFASSTNNPATLLSLPNASTTLAAGDKLAAVMPGFKVPGAPGGIVSNDTSKLQATLAAKLPTVNTSVPGATTSADLRLESTAVFSKIQNIAKGVAIQAPSLATASSSAIPSLPAMTAVGGQMSLPNSASAVSAITNSTSASAKGLGGSALQKVVSALGTPSNNPLTSIANTAKATPIGFTPPTVDLASLSKSASTTVQSSTAQVGSLVKNLPSSVSSISGLTTAQASSIKEKLVVASFAASGQLPNVAPGSIATDVSAIVDPKGLAGGFPSSVTSALPSKSSIVSSATNTAKSFTGSL